MTATKYSAERIASLYASGMSQAEVAAALGTDQQYVQRLMKRYGIKARPAIKRDQRGPRNHNWSGASVSYLGAHKRLYRQRGKARKCERCGTTSSAHRYQWSNQTGRLADQGDYKELCEPCHARQDNRARNFKGATGARHV